MKKVRKKREIHPVQYLRELYILPVRLYRRFLSPLKPASSCRFTPTCSAYAMEAVREWGIIIGTFLAVFRIVRCNPFSKGGYDPVPVNTVTRRRK